MATYEYPFSATLNGACDAAALRYQAISGVPGTNPGPFYTAGTTIYCPYPDALTSGQQDQLAAVVAAHNGQPLQYPVVFQAVKIGPAGETEVTDDGGYTTIDYVVARPEFFSTNLAACYAQLLGKVKVAGAGAAIRVVQIDGAGVQTTLGTLACADTGGDWVVKSLATVGSGLGSGYCEYLFQATRGGATSFWIRGFNGSIGQIV